MFDVSMVARRCAWRWFNLSAAALIVPLVLAVLVPATATLGPVRSVTASLAVFPLLPVSAAFTGLWATDQAVRRATSPRLAEWWANLVAWLVGLDPESVRTTTCGPR